jgi:hypothetical protein
MKTLEDFYAIDKVYRQKYQLIKLAKLLLEDAIQKIVRQWN